MAQKQTALGEGVDAHGNPVIDPTKNVLDLVKAEGEKRDLLRDADTRYQDAMRDAEKRRQDDLSAQRDRITEGYERRIYRMQEKSLDSTSTLLATQLRDAASGFTAQIRELGNMMGERISKLEQFRWESGGRTSVSDPAVSDALKEMAQTIRGLSRTDNVAEGRGLGRGELIAYLVAAAAVGGFAFNVVPRMLGGS